MYGRLALSAQFAGTATIHPYRVAAASMGGRCTQLAPAEHRARFAHPQFLQQQLSANDLFFSTSLEIAVLTF
jgi:hypothetical protein